MQFSRSCLSSQSFATPSPLRLCSSRSPARAMAHPKLKLVYFDLPGRAETTRIILNYGGIPFEDHIFDRSEWPTLKAQMPMGQVPVLEVDGKQLAQSSAIERYAAKLAGLMPDDPWAAAKVDEAVALVNELQDLFAATYAIKDEEAKIKARQDIVEGPLKAKFALLAKLIEASGGQWLAGSKPTYADIHFFKAASGLVGGIMDGIPTNLLDSYPELKAHHNRVAALPPIAKMYENAVPPRVSYKPLP